MLMDEAMSDYCAFLALELIDEKKVTFDDYPQEEAYLLRLRGRVNEEIAKLVNQA